MEDQVVCSKCGGTGRYIYEHHWTGNGTVATTYYCDICPLGPIAERQDFPNKYPPCIAEPPHSPDDPCGYETCDLHNTLWLEHEGCSHEQAIGLTAVYNFTFNAMGYGIVADTLGGLDEFDKINEDGQDWSLLIQWYNEHPALIRYILESKEYPKGLWDYWWQAKYPQHQVPDRGEISMWLVKGSDGQWVPYQTPGYPVVIPEDFQGWSDHYDASVAAMSPEEWASAVLAHFEYTRPLQWTKPATV